MPQILLAIKAPLNFVKSIEGFFSQAEATVSTWLKENMFSENNGKAGKSCGRSRLPAVRRDMTRWPNSALYNHLTSSSPPASAPYNPHVCIHILLSMRTRR